MIDINELRRKLGSDDLIDHVDIHANVKPVITELIGRIEAAEKDIALKERIIDSLGLGLNAAAHERDNLRAEVESWKGLAQQFGNELDTVRAKIAEMEKQEPVALVESWANGSYSRNYKLRWLRDVNDGARLYALPGAKGEKDVCMAETNF